ncbi:hypothetical protein T484DRAFT_3640971 [Baffinella frigidus]|nr:hypothetical protein T484DRAFT_3640971 [Cryptophyta sp. CCMP2293]
MYMHVPVRSFVPVHVHLHVHVPTLTLIDFTLNYFSPVVKRVVNSFTTRFTTGRHKTCGRGPVDDEDPDLPDAVQARLAVPVRRGIDSGLRPACGNLPTHGRRPLVGERRGEVDFGFLLHVGGVCHLSGGVACGEPAFVDGGVSIRVVVAVLAATCAPRRRVLSGGVRRVVRVESGRGNKCTYATRAPGVSPPHPPRQHCAPTECLEI